MVNRLTIVTGNVHEFRQTTASVLDPFNDPRRSTGQGTTSLSDHRVEGSSPVFQRIIQHHIDEHGNEEGEDSGTVVHLSPVDAAAPSSAPVHELVPENRESVEDPVQDELRVLF